MKNMMKYMPILAVMIFASVSCSREEELVPDRDDCYDVYFEGGQSGNYEVDVDAEPAITFRVSRSNIHGSITVPLVIEAEESGIFAMTSLRFADGERTAAFSVLFDQAVVQRTYSARISISDPRYARTYGLNDTSLEFSVVREDYETYANGIYYSPLLASSPMWMQTLEYSRTLDTYRFPDLFTEGCHLHFKWDGGLNVAVIDDPFDTGMGYQDTDGNPLGNITGNPSGAAFDIANNMFVFTFDYVIEGYGGFGELDDQFVMM